MCYLNLSGIIWVHFCEKNENKHFVMVSGNDLSRFLSKNQIVKIYPNDNLLLGSLSKIFILYSPEDSVNISTIVLWY